MSRGLGARFFNGLCGVFLVKRVGLEPSSLSETSRMMFDSLSASLDGWTNCAAAVGLAVVVVAGDDARNGNHFWESEGPVAARGGACCFPLLTAGDGGSGQGEAAGGRQGRRTSGDP